ncbi:hypothetical protein AX16_009918 [Volvariella volvacea WC 439]|nr:hypothetical protein AX16_009918 [Volvariella volvacea WC 439]
MSRKAKLAQAGPSRLSTILAHLNASPQLSLPHVKALRLSLAYKNDHFGARHFVKEDLPRIRFANPNLEIQVDRVKKSANEHWRPVMEIVTNTGSSHVINMEEKWSTTITRELMDLGGGSQWATWKADRLENKEPLLPGEQNEKPVGRRSSQGLPTLKEFRAARTRQSASA